MSVFNAQIHVKDANGVHDILPLTTMSNVSGLDSALSGKANSSHTHTVSDISDFPSTLGTVNKVKVGTTEYTPTDGVVSLPAYPTDTNTHRPIQVNGSQILGDNTTALNLKAGSNVSLSNSNGTVTIAATDTTYSGSGAISVSGSTISHLTSEGYKHVPSGGSSGDVLAYNSSGTAAWTSGYIKQAETTLSSSSNLNNCTSADTVWVCLSASSASSISNTPWTGGGFKVWNEAITSKSAIKSGSGGLFYQCLTPNNADGTLVYRRKYDSGTWGSWYKFVNASSSTFEITRYSSTYTVSAYDSYKCNGIATFTATITSSSSISANTSIPIAYVASDTKPKGSSSCYYRFVAHSDNTIAQAYIKGGDRTLYVKTPTSIPANTNILITGTYAY